MTSIIFDDDVVGAFVDIVEFFFQQYALFPAENLNTEGASPLQVSLEPTQLGGAALRRGGIWRGRRRDCGARRAVQRCAV